MKSDKVNDINAERANQMWESHYVYDARSYSNIFEQTEFVFSKRIRACFCTSAGLKVLL